MQQLRASVGAPHDRRTLRHTVVCPPVCSTRLAQRRESRVRTASAVHVVHAARRCVLASSRVCVHRVIVQCTRSVCGRNVGGSGSKTVCANRWRTRADIVDKKVTHSGELTAAAAAAAAGRCCGGGGASGFRVIMCLCHSRECGASAPTPRERFGFYLWSPRIYALLFVHCCSNMINDVRAHTRHGSVSKCDLSLSANPRYTPRHTHTQNYAQHLSCSLRSFGVCMCVVCVCQWW